MSKTNKKLLKEQHLNTILTESYKRENKEVDGSPVIASFKINVTTENLENHNGRIYPSAVWDQHYSFKKGGKYLDESGKLRPLSLLGNLDHPKDDDGDVYLSEAGLTWASLERDGDDWNGTAHVLDTPQGRIIKTFLEYAKQYGGGDQIGVSTRALGDARLVESASGTVEEIIPEDFELVSIDFVYNPSSLRANTPLMESKKRGTTLVESIQKLKAADKEDHKEVYDKVLNDLEPELNHTEVYTLLESASIKTAKAEYVKQLKDTEYKLHNAIYALDNMTDDEYKQTKYYIDTPSKAKFLAKLQKEHAEVLAEIKSAESLTESTDISARLLLIKKLNQIDKNNTLTDEEKYDILWELVDEALNLNLESELTDLLITYSPIGESDIMENTGDKMNKDEKDIIKENEEETELDLDLDDEEGKDELNPEDTDETKDSEETEETEETEEDKLDRILATMEDKLDRILATMEDILVKLDDLFAPIEPLEDLEEEDVEADEEADFTDEETDFTDEDIDSMTEEELLSLEEFLELE